MTTLDQLQPAASWKPYLKIMISFWSVIIILTTKVSLSAYKYSHILRSYPKVNRLHGVSSCGNLVNVYFVQAFSGSVTDFSRGTNERRAKARARLFHERVVAPSSGSVSDISPFTHTYTYTPQSYIQTNTHTQPTTESFCTPYCSPESFPSAVPSIVLIVDHLAVFASLENCLVYCRGVVFVNRLAWEKRVLSGSTYPQSICRPSSSVQRSTRSSRRQSVVRSSASRRPFGECV